VPEENIDRLEKAGAGGQGDVFFVDKNFVVKRCLQYKKELTKTVDAKNFNSKIQRFATNEFGRLILSQHKHVI
jgi:hypothetical protein